MKCITEAPGNNSDGLKRLLKQKWKREYLQNRSSALTEVCQDYYEHKCVLLVIN